MTYAEVRIGGGDRRAAKAEQAPKLSIRSVTVEAATVGEAAKKIKNPAGKREYDAILSNPDSDAAQKLKDGNVHFFFGTSDGTTVRALMWFAGQWYPGNPWDLDAAWDREYGRAVVKN